jgi:hypothetical protein
MEIVNRRAEPRAELNIVLAIEATGRDERAGMTRNVSRGGLVFHSASQYRPGEELSLRLAPPTSRELRSVRARVVRTRVEPPELGLLLKHVTAVAFEEPVDELTE